MKHTTIITASATASLGMIGLCPNYNARSCTTRAQHAPLLVLLCARISRTW
eukprot:TRINITY_DN3287_c0_g1_i1.p3 TRINITY_DN3287_c0_g1~~TRINITY_DN3287_c0_g1_i1.p3  ORF type:complete len:51 (-),score=2.36 TRINITY_DN3287_c0_g1_i1:231-383(-)